ncbi:MAG: hypothetical protein R3E01_23365 [Pirellulaceae bacterium]
MANEKIGLFLLLLCAFLSSLLNVGKLSAQADLFGGEAPNQSRDEQVCEVTIPRSADEELWLAFAMRKLSPCEKRYLKQSSDALRDPWNLTSGLAAITVGHIGHNDGIEVLWEAAENRFRDTETRIWSIEAVAGIAQPDAIPRLIGLLDDPRVGVDALRALLLLSRNPLKLTADDILEYCSMFGDYWPAPQPEHLLGNGGGGYPPGEKVIVYTGKELLARQIGGYRDLPCDNPYGYRGTGGFSFRPTHAGYGRDPYFSAIGLRNEIPDDARRKFANLQLRYQQWFSVQKTVRPNTAAAYRYTLIHPLMNSANVQETLGQDSILRVLAGNVPEFAEDKVPLVRIPESTRDRDPRVIAAENYIVAQLKRLSPISMAELRNIVKEDAAVLIDPLSSIAARADGAKHITEAYGKDGLHILASIAADRFENAQVRTACVQRIAELDIAVTTEVLLALSADPQLTAVAIAGIEGAVDQLKRLHRTDPTLKLDYPAHWWGHSDDVRMWVTSAVHTHQELSIWERSRQ